MPIVTWNVIFEHSFSKMFVSALPEILLLPNIKKYELNHVTSETVQNRQL